MNQPISKINCILLIDDDKVTNYLHQALIQDLGLATEIEVKQNGKDGLYFIEECCKKGSCPELILVDLLMPVMDGFEFMEAYINLPLPEHKTTIIIMTNSSDPKDVEKMKEMGVVDFIEKPLTEQILMRLVEKYCHKS